MSNNIRELRQARGWSMRELADRLAATGEAVHFTTVAKIERSQRKLTLDWVKRFAAALDASPADISDDFQPFEVMTALNNHPVIGMVAAGNWREAVQEPQSWIPSPERGKNVFGLVVDGNSMDRVAPAGAIVLVDPDQPDLHDGSHYVVMNGDGEATFKRYRADPARLEPVSTDPSHNVIILGRSQFSVIGRVVAVYQAL